MQPLLVAVITKAGVDAVVAEAAAPAEITTLLAEADERATNDQDQNEEPPPKRRKRDAASVTEQQVQLECTELITAHLLEAGVDAYKWIPLPTDSGGTGGTPPPAVD